MLSLFIIIAILIQIPAIQNKIVDTATSYISKKTHTRVEIGNISISFPKSVVIDGLFLEDMNKDTLIYAGKLKAGISFGDLFSHKIHITNFELQQAVIHINRKTADSLFNFNFLITAFSDTTKPKIEKPPSKSPWTFAIDDIGLKNIHFVFDDNFGGAYISTVINQLEIEVNRIDLKKMLFDVTEFKVDGIAANIITKKSSTTSDKKTQAVLPEVMATLIQINNTKLNYKDEVSNQNIEVAINQLELKKGILNLQTQVLELNKLMLSKSKFCYINKDKFVKDTTQLISGTEKKANNWKVSCKDIQFSENAVVYISGDKSQAKNSFDASHLEFNHLSLEANNLNYSQLKTEISIKKFTATDQHKFSITKFQTDFSMDQHIIVAKNLKLKTTNSSLEADLQLNYTSLNEMKDSIQNLALDFKIKKSSFQNAEIVYFYPKLNEQMFFKNNMNITLVSGIVNGKLKNINVKNLQISTGINTTIASDFRILGLPDYKTAWFEVPNMNINTGNQDIEMLLGESLPNNIALPENINMQLIFNGKFTSFASDLAINTSFGNAHILAVTDTSKNFRTKTELSKFDLGSLLKNKAMYGPVSLIAEANGQGFDVKTMKASILVDVTEAFFNKYTYHHLTLDGKIKGQELTGNINLNDKNAVLKCNGMANLNPGKESYKFSLNVLGADLQKLNFSGIDLRFGLQATAEFKGDSLSNLNGNACITNIIIANQDKKYRLDSVLIGIKNETGKSELTVNCPIIDLKYTASVFPLALPSQLNEFINNYFPFSKANPSKSNNKLEDFVFELKLYNHPLISEVLLPQLKDFETAVVTANYKSINNELRIKASTANLNFGSIEIKDLAVNVNCDPKVMNYKISCDEVSNATIKLDNFFLDGKIEDKIITANLSSIDEKLFKKIFIKTKITKEDENFKLSFEPKEFYLMNKRWDIAGDNYIEFGVQGFLIHHLFIENSGSYIKIASVHDKFNDDMNIAFKHFKLEDISGIIEKDSGLVKGNLDGNLLLKRENNTYGLVATVSVSKLFFHNIAIGDIQLNAENPSSDKFIIDLKLAGDENKLSLKGNFIPKDGNNTINLNLAIQSLSLNTVKAFSSGNIIDARGTLSGNLLIDGNLSSPDITGELVFNNAIISPAALNNPLEMKHETIKIKKDGIYFDSFTILDIEKHKAVIDGSIKMNHFKDFVFNLQMNTKDFLLFNTTDKDNPEFYGQMIIDSKIDIFGPMSLPHVVAKVKMKKGSNFTFAVPEKTLTKDKGNAVVDFDVAAKIDTILSKTKAEQKNTSLFKGIDISSVIEIDKQATLRLLMDPSSSDSLVVKGEAAMSFTIDRSGKMSLTGAYNLYDGSYLVSLESVIKKRFKIEQGSTITWSGDPMKADISINAIYSVRASPYDLVADQMIGLSADDKSAYKQSYPFLVLLKLRGDIMHPEISFEIQLAPEDKGILGGAVNAKLNLLNEDPSALNKQVFALLVLGRFIQENPFQSESNGTVSAVRSTVGNLLSAQLNQWGSKVLQGVELNFDIQSYEESLAGQATGRTQVDIGVKKQLFNERLVVQLGGSVDVEGDRAKQNTMNDITSDVSIEYRITEDGRYRIKAFRHNQYEGALEGQLVETGVGVLYVRDFNSWKEFFSAPKNKNDESKGENKK